MLPLCPAKMAGKKSSHSWASFSSDIICLRTLKMLDDAEDVDTYFVALIWETLDTPAYINKLFRQILTSKDDIAIILGYADVTFHHGIFDIIRADETES